MTFRYAAAPGQLKLRNRSDGVRVSFTYDEVGNRRTMADASGLLTYSYDALNRPQAMTNPG